MLFADAKEPMEERGSGKLKEEKYYLPMCSAYWLMRSAFTSTGCIHVSTAHLKQLSPVPVALTTALFVWIHRGSGIYAIPRRGSSCHNANCSDSKWENTHPDPFSSNTSITFSSCRLTLSRGSAASAYTSIISEVRVTGGCITTLGSTAL